MTFGSLNVFPYASHAAYKQLLVMIIKCELLLNKRPCFTRIYENCDRYENVSRCVSTMDDVCFYVSYICLFCAHEYLQFNTLSLDINTHVLLTVLSIFLMVLVGRICSKPAIFRYMVIISFILMTCMFEQEVIL